MSATSGWYPDPGGGQGLYRYWDGRAWSAATTTNPASAPPPQGLGNPGAATSTAGTTAQADVGWGTYGQTGSASGSGQDAYGRTPYGQSSYGRGTYPQAGSAFGAGAVGAGQSPYGQGAGQPGQPSRPPLYPQLQKRRSGIGWWVGAGALLLVLVVLAVVAIRAATGGGGLGGGASGQESADQCPPQRLDSQSAVVPPADGRVHGGPVSYPQLGSPWTAPSPEDRVPFGVNVLNQDVLVQSDYDARGVGHSWVASVLVGELQAGDGFFTPQQGSQIVVRCILGTFYGNNRVNSDVITNRATTIDGHDAWIVESKLTFDIPGLQTKGERLIVAIVRASAERSGLFYASIPDSTPELLPPARDALADLQVDG